MKTYDLFLLYYPLKQGLKRFERVFQRCIKKRFLLYYPLKQGLNYKERNKY